MSITIDLLANTILGDELAPYVLISTPARSIDKIIPDIVVEEHHTDRLEITQHPIQTGAVVTDHSFAPPAMLTMRCGFSDCTAQYLGYVQEVYQEFLALQSTRQPFNVSTGKRYYSNMLINSMEVTTDEHAETALSIVINLQQVTLVDAGATGSGMTQANQASPSETAPTVNTGNQALQPAPTSGLTPSGFVAGPN